MTDPYQDRSQPPTPFTLCVYCGSRHGARPEYTAIARAVGREIGLRGWQLVYGGGNVGLMGEVADAAMAHGARVIGVIPRSLMEREVGHRALSELHVVDTMHQRKQLMAERASAFVALPGGIGTLEELFEVWTWRQLGYHDQPIGLLNVAGYYDPLLDFMNRTVAEGFLSEAQRGAVLAGTDAVSLLDRLHIEAAAASGTDDYRRT
ncbi:MAG TPA: TIGR00730 family Rossman fold protein [Rubrivivax sp.]